MKHTTAQHMVKCNCRSVGECTHNSFAWADALDALVDDFASAMKKKLRKKFLEGRAGWDDETWDLPHIIDRLQEHSRKLAGDGYTMNRPVKEDDFVDVANFAAFAWNRFS